MTYNRIRMPNSSWNAGTQGEEPCGKEVGRCQEGLGQPYESKVKVKCNVTANPSFHATCYGWLRQP